VAEDRKLHDKYHKQNIEGYDVGKAFIESTLKHRPKYGLFKGVKDEDKIVYLDRYDHVKRKDRGQAVLEIVQRELGAVEIKPEHIWEASDIKVAKSVEPVYGAFLYVRGSKCVGFLLVQTIEEAWKVMPPTDRNPPAPNPTEPVGSAASKPKSALAKLKERKKMLSEASKAEDDALAAACNAPLSLSSSKYPAILGVSRIWTSSSHRGQGIAACLLNTAINRHNAQVAVEIEKREEALQGLNQERPGWTQNAEEKKRLDETYRVGRKIQSKAEVAFSHPTDAGTRLARKWFGKAWGWRIYSE
jgi:N-acetyltransferase